MGNVFLMVSFSEFFVAILLAFSLLNLYTIARELKNIRIILMKALTKKDKEYEENETQFYEDK